MPKPRVIISTDIGGADNDDMESMAHALLASDQWSIKALISTPTNHDGRAADIHAALDAYARDYANLKTWSSGYATPDYVKSIVYQGSLNVAPPAGYSSPTAASQAIVRAAHEAKAAGEPLWVMVWGALTDVAQALHDDPSIMPTLRVLASNGWNYTQDPHAYEYVLGHARNGLWMIDSKSTHRGIYLDENGVEGNSFRMYEAKGHGALGDYFYNARPWGVKMGDSWTIAYLTDHADDSNPWADSWGGQFVKNGLGPNYYTDDPSSAYRLGNYKGAAHVREHQAHIYEDMYRLFDRAKAPNPDAAHEPEPDPEPGSGTGHPVTAVDDAYKIDAGKTLWVNSRYFTWNDKGLDGGLHVIDVDDASAKGVAISWSEDGTMVYRPLPGFEGVDTVGYTVADKDGSTGRAKVVITVGDPDATPEPAPEPEPGTGTGHSVTAADDAYKIDAGKTLWVNSRYFTWNDKGLDGGLHVTAVDMVSAKGVAISWSEDGTMVYRPKAGFEGVDTVGYTVADKDGSAATARVVITVGDPSKTDTAPLPGTGTGNPVVAADETYKVEAGKTLWVNSRYFTWNDKGLDGGLHVTAVDKVSARGVSISWDSEGTTVYKAPAGFSGLDSFNYVVADADGSTDTGTVFIHVSSLLA